MSDPSGYINLQGGPRNEEILGWLGDWPPPMRLMCAVGKISGVSALADSRSVPRSLYLELKEDADIYYYERLSYSKQAGEERDDARAALYGFVGEGDFD
jgi:hypothetical protein